MLEVHKIASLVPYSVAAHGYVVLQNLSLFGTIGKVECGCELALQACHLVGVCHLLCPRLGNCLDLAPAEAYIY